jgi:hypothetical protein
VVAIVIIIAVAGEHAIRAAKNFPKSAADDQALVAGLRFDRAAAEN